MNLPNFRESTILVVDDSVMMRVLMTRLLKQTGFANILEAENGQIGLDVLHSHQVDLVLLDIQMPVMDGYKTLELIKADPELKDVSVIMVTAVELIESVARCIEMGADDYMPKLFNSILLTAKIESSLELRYLRRLIQERERGESEGCVRMP